MALVAVVGAVLMVPVVDAAPAPTIHVRIYRVGPSPRTLAIRPGTTVTFVNRDRGAPRVVGANGEFDSGAIGSYSVTFDVAGEFPYMVSGGATQRGRIIVVDPRPRTVSSTPRRPAIRATPSPAGRRGQPLATPTLPTATQTPTGKSSPTPVASPPPTAVPALWAVVLAGQSNMAGNNVKDAPAAPEDNRVWVFEGGWRPIASLEKAGSSRVIDGPGLPFARKLVRSGTARSVGLIPCAVGGTSIKEWLPDDAVYQECVRRIRSAGLPIAGVLFYQGENDTLHNLGPKWPTTWAEKFETMVGAFRADVGDARLPIVFAQLATTTRDGLWHWQTIKDQQASVAISGVSMVKTDDLPLRDGLHLTDEAAAIVGERFALALRGLGLRR
jgi:plastocyanin